jgi:hypothetical protein
LINYALCDIKVRTYGIPEGCCFYLKYMLFKLKKIAKWQKKALLSLFALSAMVSLVLTTVVRAQDNKSIIVVASTMANGLLSSSSSIVISSVSPLIKSITVIPTNFVKLVKKAKFSCR